MATGGKGSAPKQYPTEGVNMRVAIRILSKFWAVELQRCQIQKLHCTAQDHEGPLMSTKKRCTDRPVCCSVTLVVTLVVTLDLRIYVLHFLALLYGELPTSTILRPLASINLNILKSSGHLITSNHVPAHISSPTDFDE